MDRGRGMGDSNYRGRNPLGGSSMGRDRGSMGGDYSSSGTDRFRSGMDRDDNRGEFGDGNWNRSGYDSLGRGMSGGRNIGMDRDRDTRWGAERSIDRSNRGDIDWTDRGYGMDRGDRSMFDRDQSGEHHGFMDRVRESFRGRGPKGYQRSDERIREEVCEMLERDHHIDASDIDVTVSGATVTLAGTVPDRSMKRRAEDLAEAAAGVRDVHNSLSVHRGRGAHTGDRDRDDNEMSSGVLGLTTTENYEEGGAAGTGATHASGTSGGTRRSGISGTGSLPMTSASANSGYSGQPMTNPGAVTTGANSQENRSSNAGMVTGKSTAADRANKKR